jgi:integrase/recombinase XerD
LNWNSQITGYRSFLRIEKSLSRNSVQAYLNDLDKLKAYFELKQLDIQPEEVEYTHLKEFLVWIGELGMSPRSQARIVSGIKSFFRYMIIDEKTVKDPPNCWRPETGT